MKLPLKITLLLFAVIALFIGPTSYYFYGRIEDNFESQAEQRIQQSTSLIDQRLQFLRDSLQSEMTGLATGLYAENETILASILAFPPDFNTEVIHFAEKLRRRSALDFLLILNPERRVVSDSLHPAAFNKPVFPADLPQDEIRYVFEDAARMELEKKSAFGGHVLYLRGGFYLKEELERLPLSGIKMEVRELNPEASTPASSEELDPMEISRTIELKDYHEKPIARIRISISREPLLQEKAKLIHDSTIFIAASFMACLLLGSLLSLGITRPVRRLRDAAVQMSAGNLEVRVEEGASGEMGELVRAFNRMAADLEEKQKALAQSERIAAWQEIARHLAHEIKNPLTPIRTSIANLRLCMEKAPEKFPEIFLESSASIQEEVEKLRHLADEFARFARLPAPNKKTANLNDVIRKSITLYSGGFPQIEFQPAEIPEFAFDPEQLSEVIHNLLQNAVDAVGSNGMIKVFTATQNQGSRIWVDLIVEDNGIGMAEEVRKQIFTPYFTTKDKGTGLGLAIVQRIIQEHGGQIFVESAPGKGTRFEVKLPA